MDRLQIAGRSSASERRRTDPLLRSVSSVGAPRAMTPNDERRVWSGTHSAVRSEPAEVHRRPRPIRSDESVDSAPQAARSSLARSPVDGDATGGDGASRRPHPSYQPVATITAAMIGNARAAQRKTGCSGSPTTSRIAAVDTAYMTRNGRAARRTVMMVSRRELGRGAYPHALDNV